MTDSTPATVDVPVELLKESIATASDSDLRHLDAADKALALIPKSKSQLVAVERSATDRVRTIAERSNAHERHAVNSSSGRDYAAWDRNQLVDQIKTLEAWKEAATVNYRQMESRLASELAKGELAEQAVSAWVYSASEADSDIAELDSQVAALRDLVDLADKAPHEGHCGFGTVFAVPAGDRRDNGGAIPCTCWKAEYDAAKGALK